MSRAAASTNFEESAKQALSAAAVTGDTPAPHPELNGLILQLPGAPQLYLVLNAFRCWIPDPQTANNLFNSGFTVVPDINIGVVALGAPLTSGAILAKGDQSETVYLVTNGVKMGIPSPDVFNRYQFNWNKVQTFPQIVIDYIPTGPVVQGPQPLA